MMRLILHILNMGVLLWLVIFMYSNINNPNYILLLLPLGLLSMLLSIVGLGDIIRIIKAGEKQ